MMPQSALAEMEDYGDETGAEQEAQGLTIEDLMQAENIADLLNEEELSLIGSRVCDEYQIDCSTRKDWETAQGTASDLAMLIASEKTYPWPNASNVKHPMLAQAAFEFNARAYPAIVQGNRVVKCNVWGKDPDGQKANRSERVSEHLSFQCLVEMPEWEEDTDRLLVMLPIAGCVFRKIWFDPSLGRKVSRLVTADNLVVNYFARSLGDVPRATERMDLYPYEIQERILSGRFIEFEYKGLPAGGDSDNAKETPRDDNDDQAPHRFLEQHRRLDLDQDGYAEPYIVTVHEGSEKVCRIVANYDAESVRVDQAGGNVVAIRKRDFYVKYDFLPSPDGGFYGIGFGYLLKDVLEAINTTINQMLDAGKLANMQGGLVSATLGLREKKITLQPGEWKTVNTTGPMNQAVLPIKYDGPNPVLFSLLGLLIETGEGISAIKDVLTGEGQGKNASPTTTLALIDQGLSVFTAIFKRVHRALKAELGIHARLNRENPDPVRYNALFDGEEEFDPVQDYSEADMDILPVSDPNVASRMQELAKADLLQQIGGGNPMIDQSELLRRIMEAAKIEDVDGLLVPPPEPDPFAEELMKVMALLEAEDKAAGIKEKMTRALKNVADAEAAEEGIQMDSYKLFLETLVAEMGAEQAGADGQGGIPGMAGQPGNEMVHGAAGGDSGGGVLAAPPPDGGAALQPGPSVPPA